MTTVTVAIATKYGRMYPTSVDMSTDRKEFMESDEFSAVELNEALLSGEVVPSINTLLNASSLKIKNRELLKTAKITEQQMSTRLTPIGEVVSRAMPVGTAVHANIEHFWMGHNKAEEDFLFSREEDQLIKYYTTLFKKWFEETPNVFTNYASELTVIGNGYGCTLDFTGLVNESVQSIDYTTLKTYTKKIKHVIDWKTCSKVPTNHYRSMLQVTAQAMAIRAEVCTIVYFSKEGHWTEVTWNVFSDLGEHLRWTIINLAKLYIHTISAKVLEEELY